MDKSRRPSLLHDECLGLGKQRPPLPMADIIGKLSTVCRFKNRRAPTGLSQVCQYLPYIFEQPKRKYVRYRQRWKLRKK